MTTAGLDVGGAHLKVALAENGVVTAVAQYPCPLWQGIDKLEQALEQASALIGSAGIHGVTMTAELSDLFQDRCTGVSTLVSILSDYLGPCGLFWMGRRGFGDADDAIRHWSDVASTNFLATAEFVARRRSDALLVDMGSTTTDIVAICGGRPVIRGFTDAERLETGELVYTGLTRSAVMAVAQSAPFDGRMQGLALEYFATMADVRRILDELPDGVDQHATADNRGKSVDESFARFARMFGRDTSDAPPDVWRRAARDITHAQAAMIDAGCQKVMTASALHPAAPVIVAGIGADAVRAHVASSARPVEDFGSLTGASGDTALWATRCAPAASVALLRSREI